MIRPCTCLWTRTLPPVLLVRDPYCKAIVLHDRAGVTS